MLVHGPSLDRRSRPKSITIVDTDLLIHILQTLAAFFRIALSFWLLSAMTMMRCLLLLLVVFAVLDVLVQARNSPLDGRPIFGVQAVIRGGGR